MGNVNGNNNQNQNINQGENMDQNLSASENSSSNDNILPEIEKNITKSVSSSSCSTSDQTMDEFKEELRQKRVLRQNAISDLKKEFFELKTELLNEKELNKKLMNKIKEYEENIDEKKGSLVDSDSYKLKQINANLQFELQLVNSEVLSLNNELDVTRKQVQSLKEVINVSKKMIDIREEQVNQLKVKLEEIEDSFSEKELKIMSDDLRREYNRQLENIKNLKVLYEERAKVSGLERDNIKKELGTIKSDLTVEIEKTKTLTESLDKLQADLEETKSELQNTLHDKRKLEMEMSTINELSSQILMGFSSGNDINLDKLTEVLEENRDLLTDMTSQENVLSSEGASVLPKLLFDLVVKADCDGVDEESREDYDGIGKKKDNKTNKCASAEEIIGNLPKVWRVLMEFLSHQQGFTKVKCTDDDASVDCYKSVETSKGNEVVLSVSKTFMKLKDLILEKKSLQKETNRLKTLNSHLDKRLKSQEKRLGVVSFELTKTWHLVGRMQRQHRQLHTNEQILRYQLQQKRRMLNELKEELEYCRKKWAQAREKNNESEDQWRILKSEFKSRKVNKISVNDGNNSAESGYSDEQNSDDDDDDDVKEFKKDLHIETINDSPKKDETLEEMFYRLNSIFEKPCIPTPNLSEEEAIVKHIDETVILVPSISFKNSTSSSTLTANPTIPPLTNISSEPKPSTSSLSILTKAEEEYTKHRAERLQRLEDQCKNLLFKCASNVTRGVQMDSQIDLVHNRHGKLPDLASDKEIQNSDSHESEDDDENDASE